MDWKLQRAEHSETLVLYRVDGAIGSTALYVLAYTGLVSEFRKGGAISYVLYSMPILMMAYELFTMYSSVLDAVGSFRIRRSVSAAVGDPEIRAILSPRWMPGYTTLARSCFFPTLLTLLWAFLMAGFGAGSIAIVVPVACAAALGTLCLALGIGLARPHPR